MDEVRSHIEQMLPSRDDIFLHVETTWAKRSKSLWQTSVWIEDPSQGKRRVLGEKEHASVEASQYLALAMAQSVSCKYQTGGPVNYSSEPVKSAESHPSRSPEAHSEAISRNETSSAARNSSAWRTGELSTEQSSTSALARPTLDDPKEEGNATVSSGGLQRALGRPASAAGKLSSLPKLNSLSGVEMDRPRSRTGSDASRPLASPAGTQVTKSSSATALATKC